MKNENIHRSSHLISDSSVNGGDPLTYAVIGAAMQVHSELGPGLDEVFYHGLLSTKLHAGGVAHQSKPRGELFHRGKSVDIFECDLLFQDELVAELKTLAGSETFAPEHLTQLICYLKFWRVKTGLLLDFGKERLTYRRVVYTEKPVASENDLALASSIPPHDMPEKTVQVTRESLKRVCQMHGLGYRDTTYRGLVAADLAVENVQFVWQPAANIVGKTGLPLGSAGCNCFVIENTIALMVLALRNRITTTDRAILRTYLKHLRLENGLIANFGKQQLELIQVGNPELSDHTRHE